LLNHRANACSCLLRNEQLLNIFFQQPDIFKRMVQVTLPAHLHKLTTKIAKENINLETNLRRKIL
jgi:hypothetical protein